MPKKKRSPDSESAKILSFALDDFDYRMECDDFLLYELGRLIEEDNASFENDEFRGVINQDVHEHIDTRLEVRAELARRLRIVSPKLDTSLRPVAARILHAVEDAGSPLSDIGLIVRTYT